MRRLRSGIVVLLWALVPAPAASADSLALAPVPAQPTDASGLQIHVSGSASVTATVRVVYRQSGTGPCGGIPGTQGGDPGGGFPPDGTPVTGAFDVTGTPPQSLAVGSYQFCGYLVDSSGDAGSGALLAGPVSLGVTVRAADTIALDPPADAVQGRPLNVGVHGTMYDGSAVIDATYKRAGGACAATPAADTGTVTNDSGTSPGAGAYSTPVASGTLLDPGDWLVCAWIVDPSFPGSPLAATAATAHVRPLAAKLVLRLPVRVDAAESFPVTATATVEHDIQVEAIVKQKPARGGAACASSPTAEPTGDAQVLDQQLTDTQQPAGSVSSDPATVTLPGAGRYLVCGWLLGAWSGQAAGAPAPVVAGPVASTVTAVSAQVFRGRTSQHHGFKLVIAPVQRHVLEVAYTDNIHCRGVARLQNGLPWDGIWSNDLTPSNFGTLAVSRSGLIHTSLNGNPNLGLVLTARERGSRIAGSFTERGRSFAFTGNTAQSLPCTSGRVSFLLRGR